MMAELKDAKISDDDGVIEDGRRIIQLDELPQFLDYTRPSRPRRPGAWVCLSRRVATRIASA